MAGIVNASAGREVRTSVGAGGDGPASSSATTPRVMTRLATASTTTPVASARVPT